MTEYAYALTGVMLVGIALLIASLHRKDAHHTMFASGMALMFGPILTLCVAAIVAIQVGALPAS